MWENHLNLELEIRMEKYSVLRIQERGQIFDSALKREITMNFRE
jgi:hypothetical protein